MEGGHGRGRAHPQAPHTNPLAGLLTALETEESQGKIEIEKIEIEKVEIEKVEIEKIEIEKIEIEKIEIEKIENFLLPLLHLKLKSAEGG